MKFTPIQNNLPEPPPEELVRGIASLLFIVAAPVLVILALAGCSLVILAGATKWAWSFLH